MKKIIGALAIAAIVGGGVYSASAATKNTEKSSMRAELTDAQKQILSQIKTLRESGKDTEAEALAKANGLDRGFKNRPKPTEAQIASMKAIRSAIEANDYNTFTTAIKGTPVDGKVDSATFSELVSIHALRKQAQTAEKAFADKHQDLLMLVGPSVHGDMLKIRK
jgi:flagellar biosynthesis GTPase FlhF